jgi:ketosteroid isomerase-like protein
MHFSGAGKSGVARTKDRIWLYEPTPDATYSDTHLTSQSTFMPSTSSIVITPAFLAAFAEAWNRHDLSALLGFMHPDCVFEAAAGPLACGQHHIGLEAVSKAFEAAWLAFPDAQWRNGRHWVAGERGVSEWTFTGTAHDGSRIEADGVDIFTFKDGKILVKNAFRKDRPRLPASPPSTL